MIVPDFYLRGKDLIFPKIKNSKDLINNELNKRDIVLYAGGEVLSKNGHKNSTSSFTNANNGKPPKRNIAAKLHSSLA